MSKKNITIIHDYEEFTFEADDGKTVLEVALDNDLDAPYSCKGGVCATCMSKVTEGEANMKKNNVLTDSEVKAGLVLTCQAVPTTDSITVDYDEV